MRRKRTRTTEPLYEAQHGTKHCREGRLCVECGGPLTGRQLRWCGQDCVRTYQIRQGGPEARRAVFKRDHGVCSSCGIDTEELRELIKRADVRGLEAWSQDLRRGSLRARLDQYRWKGRALARRLPASPREGTQAWHKLEARKIVLTHLDVRLVAYAWRKTWWDMDHVVAVKEGGGGCGLEDLRTLCLTCHQDRTSKQNSGPRTGRARRLPRLSREACQGCTDKTCRGCLRYRKRILGR